MKTKAGKVLSAEEWDASLERLMYKPPRMPVELYCKFVQVPTAQLDEDELKVLDALLFHLTCRLGAVLSVRLRCPVRATCAHMPDAAMVVCH